MNKLKHVFAPLLVIIAGLSSCYPVDDLEVEDLDVAATLYDPAYYSPESGNNDFEALQTFVVIDTVVHIVDDPEEDELSRKYDNYVIEQIRLNMLALGFIEETDPDAFAPDVAITVSAMSSEHEVYTWYPYWGWYWGYTLMKSTDSKADADSHAEFKTYADKTNTLTPNYYYYPWLPYGSYYSYQSGSVLIEMVDVARFDILVEAIPVIWAGIINGVISESASGTQTRLSKGIDQCFMQSPYLQKSLNKR